MELRVKEVNGALRAVVRDADGVDHFIRNVPHISVETIQLPMWEAQITAVFSEKPLK